ncbi:uncharacterized protein TRUGW13939_04203 [Talaromyces rugulosus]|uniref:Multiple myeloma tumor-associated protein 2-like N-terminal domain-containing protein n=1 Tax=Talaromyces rugulosus TaxID=121627 RepID=A0A7H8QUE8_TALRU|nr:uncharacterized protein TRUGW13939_04203 [Talaromyces rugulosus]QKX57095.1 hypothetical protein TRUGW13939_04203 [Talaromyces rugulosus]
MDLVAGVRKEGSRGGRGDFKWTDVKDSSHRENYLGHSLMAPVGRWQNGRDLGWYAKSGEDDSEEAADRAKRELEDERRRVKEAEQEAMARALGLPVAPKTSDANLTPLGGGDVRKAVQGVTETEDRDDEGGRGIGFGSYGGHVMDAPEGEILAPVARETADQGATGPETETADDTNTVTATIVVRMTVETVRVDVRVGEIKIESALIETTTTIARNATNTIGATGAVHPDLDPDPHVARSIVMAVKVLESMVPELTVDVKLIGMTTEERGDILIVNVERRR